VLSRGPKETEGEDWQARSLKGSMIGDIVVHAGLIMDFLFDSDCFKFEDESKKSTSFENWSNKVIICLGSEVV
jgi:hypothetical protein